ncbi:hypothetical protein OPIT5_06265 [Opitutaceae bacterium TAV5]|nr:hypothetical protein OPIT5_06265 [Opitutaceae bacterium TAV5]
MIIPSSLADAASLFRRDSVVWKHLFSKILAPH